MSVLTRCDLRLALSLMAVACLGACAHEPPQPIARDAVVELTATVEAIDMQRRMVSLRGAGGRAATIYAGPNVRNLDQVKVGDEVVVSYYEAIGAEVTTATGATKGVEQDGAVFRAAKGARPAGAVAETLTTTVKIDSVDTSMHTVTFRRDDGLMRTLAIEDPEARAFIRSLKRGDLVQVTYMEAVAVAVRPAS